MKDEPKRYSTELKEMIYGRNITNIEWKYNEDKILEDLRMYLANTYSEHYKTKDTNIECFDAWIALGDSGPTFRNTALKYLWRYGKKKGKNKDDLMKALHYIVLLMHVEHYNVQDVEYYGSANNVPVSTSTMHGDT